MVASIRHEASIESSTHFNHASCAFFGVLGGSSVKGSSRTYNLFSCFRTIRKLRYQSKKLTLVPLGRLEVDEDDKNTKESSSRVVHQLVEHADELENIRIKTFLRLLSSMRAKRFQVLRTKPEEVMRSPVSLVGLNCVPYRLLFASIIVASPMVSLSLCLPFTIDIPSLLLLLRCGPVGGSFRFTTKPKPFRDSLGGAFGVHTHIDVDLPAVNFGLHPGTKRFPFLFHLHSLFYSSPAPYIKLAFHLPFVVAPTSGLVPIETPISSSIAPRRRFHLRHTHWLQKLDVWLKFNAISSTNKRSKWINGNVCCAGGKMDDITVIVAEVVVHETVILGTETAAVLKAQGIYVVTDMKIKVIFPINESPSFGNSKDLNFELPKQQTTDASWFSPIPPNRCPASRQLCTVQRARWSKADDSEIEQGSKDRRRRYRAKQMTEDEMVAGSRLRYKIAKPDQ
ncbi:hypothetical protein LXL04_007341 [Taraxacum kok-saghyz]